MKKKSLRKSIKKKSIKKKSLKKSIKKKSKKFDSGKIFSKVSTDEIKLKHIEIDSPFFKELWKEEGVIEYYTDMSAKDIIKICIKNKKEYKGNIVPVAKQKLVEDVNAYIDMYHIADYEESKEKIIDYLKTLKDEK